MRYEQQSKPVAVTLVNKELNEDGVLFIFSIDIDDTLFSLSPPQLYSIDNKQIHCFAPIDIDAYNISNTEQIEQCGMKSISIHSLMTRIKEFLKYEFFENYAKSCEGEKWIF